MQQQQLTPEGDSSAAKPAAAVAETVADHCVIAFWNIGWCKEFLAGVDNEKRKKHLAHGFHVALNDYCVDILLLCECGEIGEGLDANVWIPLVQQLAGDHCVVRHQGHYTSIVRRDSVRILNGPVLMGPMATWGNKHDYRKCQYLSIALKDSADKPINVFNVHSPATKEHPMPPTVRKEILEWLLNQAGDRAVIGGDLNCNIVHMNAEFQGNRGFRYHYEANHWNGDIVVSRGVEATSLACDVCAEALHRTSFNFKGHRMCIVMVQSIRGSASKPAAGSGRVSQAAPKEAASQEDALTSPDWAGDDSEEDADSSRDSSRSDADSGKGRLRPKTETPLVDAMFKNIGEHFNADETEQALYDELVAMLWRGRFFKTRRGESNPTKPAKARLELMLRTAKDVREKYQMELFDQGPAMTDLNFQRSLDDDETKHVHNAWMNDVAAWMHPACLQRYQSLLSEADERDRLGVKGRGKTSGRQKDRNEKKQKGSAAKPARKWLPPRQEAQQIKKQRFNKVISDLACKKTFFLAFVQHPSTHSVEGILQTLCSLDQIKQSDEYKIMVETSIKKTEQQQVYKRKRDQAFSALKRARRNGERDDEDVLQKAYDFAYEEYARVRNLC